MVWYVRCTYCAEQYGIVLLQLFYATIRYVFAGLLVGITAPVVVLEVKLECLQRRCEGIEDLDAGFYDLWSNAITVCESASIRDVYSTASIIPSAFTITCETSIRSF